MVCWAEVAETADTKLQALVTLDASDVRIHEGFFYSVPDA